MSTVSIEFLLSLENVISERRQSPTETSYTASLFQAGTKKIAQKVGEEGVELGLAAVAGDRDEVINEAADLLYHVLVLLSDQDIRLADVVSALEDRHAR